MSGAEPEIRRARPLLGTLVEIRAQDAGSRRELNSAIEAAFARIALVQSLMSYHDPASELSRLNRAAATAPQRVHAHTYAVLVAALRLAELSGGAFDPCIGDSLEGWGCLPDHGFGPARRASWRDVELLSACRVRFRRPLRLDLGGIAKGYAVDLALEALRAAGVREASVNAGGDLRVSGERAQRITVRHPQRPHLSGHTLTLREAALATSAAYYSRRQLRAREVSMLVEPLGRRPYLGTASVSVRAADCLSADALTKVVLFATRETAERVLCACHARAYVQP